MSAGAVVTGTEVALDAFQVLSQLSTHLSTLPATITAFEAWFVEAEQAAATIQKLVTDGKAILAQLQATKAAVKVPTPAPPPPS